MDINEIDRLFEQVTAFYDHGGRKITEARWRELQRDEDYSTVARTQVFDRSDCFGASFFVSTVWLGKNFGTADSLLIFETLVTDRCGKEVACSRASSTAAAWELHEQMVMERKSSCVDPVVLNVHRSSHV